MEQAGEKDFSATLTQGFFFEEHGISPHFSGITGRLEGPVSRDETKTRQRKLGEVCKVAAVSRPDICARLARTASRGNSLCGSDAYRINELVRVAKERHEATAYKYVSPSRPSRTLGGAGKAKDDLCNRGEKMYCGST